MSISFRGEGELLDSTRSLDLNNKLASRLLKAIGYPVTEESSGELELVVAQAATYEAIRKYTEVVQRNSTDPKDYTADALQTVLLTAHDLTYLHVLAELIDLLESEGAERLVWS